MRYILEENNRLLKEILEILKKITGKEYREQEDLKAFAINLLADIMVEYKAEQFEELAKNIKL